MGPLTQEDPIGLAGGLNLYGFAAGDPVNFSDPFGLCVEDDRVCQDLVAQLRSLGSAFFSGVADVFDAFQGAVSLVDRDILGGAEATTSNIRQTVRFANDLDEGDFLVVAAHESFHLIEGGGFSHGDDVQGFPGGPRPAAFWASIRQTAFNELPSGCRRERGRLSTL